MTFMIMLHANEKFKKYMITRGEQKPDNPKNYRKYRSQTTETSMIFYLFKYRFSSTVLVYIFYTEP